MLLLLAWSIDSQLQDKTDPQDTQLAVDSDPIDTVDTVDSAVPVEECNCNGLDDEGDGEVDEDFGDYDGDGIVDCLDEACVLRQTAAGSVPTKDECSNFGWEPPTNPWEFAVSWAATGGPQYSPPAILRTTDRNGDGVLDADDPPDVYSVDLYSFSLWRFAGDGTAADLVASDVHISSVALGDVDQDGVPNLVIARHSTEQVCALEPDGTELWCSADVDGSTGGSPVLTDLDHDGAVEVIDVGGVADGATGTLEAELCTPAGFFTQPALGDVDGDGTDEVLCGLALYRADGTVLFDVSDKDDVVSTSFVDGNLDGTPRSSPLTFCTACGRTISTATSPKMAVGLAWRCSPTRRPGGPLRRRCGRTTRGSAGRCSWTGRSTWTSPRRSAAEGATTRSRRDIGIRRPAPGSSSQVRRTSAWASTTCVSRTAKTGRCSFP